MERGTSLMYETDVGLRLARVRAAFAAHVSDDPTNLCDVMAILGSFAGFLPVVGEYTPEGSQAIDHVWMYDTPSDLWVEATGDQFGERCLFAVPRGSTLFREDSRLTQQVSDGFREYNDIKRLDYVRRAIRMLRS